MQYIFVYIYKLVMNILYIKLVMNYKYYKYINTYKYILYVYILYIKIIYQTTHDLIYIQESWITPNSQPKRPHLWLSPQQNYS